MYGPMPLGAAKAAAEIEVEMEEIPRGAILMQSFSSGEPETVIVPESRRPETKAWAANLVWAARRGLYVHPSPKPLSS